MSPELSDQDEYNEATLELARRRASLDAAIERRAQTNGRISYPIADKVVEYHERAVFRSDQHVGMIAAVRSLEGGVPPEVVAAELDY